MQVTDATIREPRTYLLELTFAWPDGTAVPAEPGGQELDFSPEFLFAESWQPEDRTPHT